MAGGAFGLGVCAPEFGVGGLGLVSGVSHTFGVGGLGVVTSVFLLFGGLWSVPQSMARLGWGKPLVIWASKFVGGGWSVVVSA